MKGHGQRLRVQSSDSIIALIGNSDRVSRIVVEKGVCEKRKKKKFLRGVYRH